MTISAPTLVDSPWPALARLTRDPRHWQIAILGCLVIYGRLGLGLPLPLARAACVIGVALAVQWTCGRWVGLPRFDARSPLITGLSLTLLLRTGSTAIACLAVAVAIASKFAIRHRGKHLFNPANFGLVAAMLVFDNAWISPGQWGSAAWMALFLVGAGLLVARRAERSDITWATLGAWALVVFGRAAWLGDPWSIPVHQLGSGAFLIFAFFMISDPKTTPDRRSTRIFHAFLVASVAGAIEFLFYQPAGLIWSLAICTPAVPLLDRLWPAQRYAWPGQPAEATATQRQAPTLPLRPIATSPPKENAHVPLPNPTT